MDISSEFKACIRSAAKINEQTKNSQKRIDNSNVKTKTSSFLLNSQAIATQASKVYDQLVKNHELLSSNKYIANKTCSAYPNLTELKAQEIIDASFRHLESLKTNIEENCVSKQHYEHRKIILMVIVEYLKYFCKMYADVESLCINRVVKQTEIKKLKSIVDKRCSFTKKELDSKPQTTNKSLNIQEINNDIAQNPASESNAVFSEDVQILEAENEQLFSNLNILTEDIKQIENKVVHINELQEIFMDKVMNQDKTLDNVMTTIVGSTENVREANQQIREAIQRNAGLRVWILFFLLIMSFTLIFLDWYDS